MSLAELLSGSIVNVEGMRVLRSEANTGSIDRGVDDGCVDVSDGFEVLSSSGALVDCCFGERDDDVDVFDFPRGRLVLLEDVFDRSEVADA